MKIFLSYTRNKDVFNAVSTFRDHFESEIRNFEPGAVVFQDRHNILEGDVFPTAIEEALVVTDVLVVLLSPAWFKSPWCRKEFDTFISAREGDGRLRPVLPVLWVNTPRLDDPGDDPVARVLAAINFSDWRELRHENWVSPALSRQVAALAERAVELARS